MLFTNAPALQMRESLTLEKHHGKSSDKIKTTAEQKKTAHYFTTFLIAHTV